MMTHLFIPYELADKAKQKGFNEPVLGFFNNDLAFPRLFPSIQDVKAMSDLEDADILFIGYEDADTVFIDYRAMDDEVSAITQTQLVDWFEKKHSLYIYFTPILDQTVSPEKMVFLPGVRSKDDTNYDINDIDNQCDSAIEALNKAIEFALTLISQK